LNQLAHILDTIGCMVGGRGTSVINELSMAIAAWMD
jgi:hypothetical protein